MVVPDRGQQVGFFPCRPATYAGKALCAPRAADAVRSPGHVGQLESSTCGSCRCPACARRCRWRPAPVAARPELRQRMRARGLALAAGMAAESMPCLVRYWRALLAPCWCGTPAPGTTAFPRSGGRAVRASASANHGRPGRRAWRWWCAAPLPPWPAAQKALVSWRISSESGGRVNSRFWRFGSSEKTLRMSRPVMSSMRSVSSSTRNPTPERSSVRWPTV